MESTATERLRRIHIALEQAGSIGGAANLLGVDKSVVRNEVAKRPELKSYLPNAEPPTQDELIARKPIPPPAPVPAPVQASAMDTAAAIKLANEQLRNGFEAIGVSGASLKEAMAYRDFAKLHFADMRQYVGGGLAKLFADLMAELPELRKEIATCGNPDREAILREDRSRIVSHLLQINDRVRESALTSAKIEALKSEKKKGKGGKPSFPILMRADHVTMQNGPAAQSSGSSTTVVAS